jgi:hypothetical protein
MPTHAGASLGLLSSLLGLFNLLRLRRTGLLDEDPRWVATHAAIVFVSPEPIDERVFVIVLW